MADDVVVSPSASYTVAADVIGEVAYQRIKLDIGADGVTSPVNATNALPVSGTVTVNGTVAVANGASVTIQQGASVSAAVSGTVTVANGASVTIQQGASVVAQASGTVSVSGPVQVSGAVSISAMPAVSGTLTVNQSGIVPVTTAASVSVSGVPVWLNPTQQVGVSGTVTISPTVLTVNTAGTIAGASVTVQAGVSVTVVTQLGTQVVSVVPGLSVSAVVSGTVTVAGHSTTAVPSVSATGGVIWIAGGQSTTAFPVVITGTVTAGAGTTVVSLTGSAQVSGTVTVAGTVGVTNASVFVGTSATPAANASGMVVWVANPGGAVATTVITVQTILGTAVVSVVPGLSVSAVVSGTVTAIAASTAVATVTQAAVTGAVVWLAPTQTMQATVNTIAAGFSVNALVTGAVSVSAMPAVSLSVSAALGTVITILGTQIVSVVPGLSVSAVVSGTVTAVNSGILFTIGLPTQASTAQIVVVKPAPMQYVQIVVASTAIAVSANKYAFTIWTGLTGAPAAVGTTSWAVPAGKVLSLKALQAAITSSAVLGGSVQLFVGVGATASMISASIPTQLQVLKLQLFAEAAFRSEALIGHQADIQAGESIAVFIIASTAAVLRDLVIAGNLY